MLDSEPPSRAIVTARRLAPEKLFAFAAAVQAARFREGRDLNDNATYRAVCGGLGLDAEPFLCAYGSEQMRRATQEVFAEAAQVAQAYPTLVAERRGQFFRIEEGCAPLDAVATRIERLLADG